MTSQTRTTAKPTSGSTLGIILAVVAVIIMILQPQAVWVPLVENYHTVVNASTLAEAAPALLDDFARQPWSGYRAANAGYAAMQGGDYDLAITYFQRSAELSGWNPDLYKAVGDAYAGQGNTEQAIIEWDKAWQAGLTNVSVLSRLAIAYEEGGDYPRAAEVLTTLIEQDPENGVAYYRLGVVLLPTDLPQALAYFLTAAQIDPSLAQQANLMSATIDASRRTDDRALQLAGLGFGLINVGEYAMASNLLNQSIAISPNLAAAYAYLGLAEQRQGRDGLPFFEQALAVDPQSALAYTLLGVYWSDRGENLLAIDALTTALQLDPLNPDLQVELGSVYLRQGDLNNAETWFTNAQRLAPTEPRYAVLLAEFYLNNDYKPDSGIEWAQRAVLLDPDSATANDIYGFSLWFQGRWAEARSVLNYALEQNPNLASAHYHLGLVLAETGEFSSARTAYEQALALDPEGYIGNLALNALARLP